MVDTLRRPPRRVLRKNNSVFFYPRMDGLILTNFLDRWVCVRSYRAFLLTVRLLIVDFDSSNGSSFILLRFQRGAKSEGVTDKRQTQYAKTDKKFDLTLVAKLKTFQSMPNLCVVCNDEGFKNITIRVEERVMWVDVEGIPSVAWTHKTFAKIASRWGKVSVIRAREIIGWNPDFIKDDNESNTDCEESEEYVSYTDICSGVKGHGSTNMENLEKIIDSNEEESNDPFNIYNILNQANQKVDKEPSLLSDGDNKPPMLKKHLYDSWKSRMELYMINKPHGRMILASVEKGPLVWPTITVDGVTRPKEYTKLTPAETIQADCDIKAINIILQGLPTEIMLLLVNIV
ncbi:hypothetical protein Tco_0975082 [Tanacetum coccineum]|uniref:Uncharacterized protein n=1 Tax=Tanacetum coccineum TaxID=301880 RepID=A0ABQ5EDD7_9ASTR